MITKYIILIKIFLITRMIKHIATIKMQREYLAFLVNVFKLLLVLGLHS
jgi:uncharacterized membrane protein